MEIFKFFQRQNMIQIYTKTHQIAPFKKISRGGDMLTNPPTKRMANFPFATYKFQNLKKYLLAPPAKSWGRPWERQPLLDFSAGRETRYTLKKIHAFNNNNNHKNENNNNNNNNNYNNKYLN